MKKFYYSSNENIEIPIENIQRDDIENERRKQLSIETNRRRREMALKVKREIEKEERRRQDVLKQRKEYQNSLNEKLRRRNVNRCPRTSSVQQLTSSDLDRTLTVLRSNAPPSSLKQKSQSSEDIAKYSNRLESAWSDYREVCASPMLKYCGHEGSNKHRDNDYYLKTFETKLLEQEEAFRQRQNAEMTMFNKVLDETVVHTANGKKYETTVDERATYRMDHDSDHQSKNDILECLDDEDSEMDDSLEVNCKSYIPSELKPTVEMEPQKKETKSTKMENAKSDVSKEETKNVALLSPRSVANTKDEYVIANAPKESLSRTKPLQPLSATTIKSILKKGLSNKFGSNPDLSGSERSVDIRDSVEITKTRSSKLFRSSSFSHGINDCREQQLIQDNSSEDANKKFVRFADDSHTSTTSLSLTQPPKSQHPPITMIGMVPLSTPVSDSGRIPCVQRVNKQPTVPGSTPLKPPLHPRTTQEGSYLQATLKRTPAYQPPPRPRKINVETLDKQLDPILHPRRPHPISATIARDSNHDKPDDCLMNIALEKTPTENEIEQLWAEVRECLSKSRTTTKPESVGPVSGRTIDSGSDMSVRSAPSWQRSVQRGPPFQVRHHRPWSGRPVPYQGQENPIRNEVTVHSHNGLSPSVVTQQPLSVISQRDQHFQAVSESMEEFLSIEGSCNTPNSRQLSSTTPASTVFLPRPPSNSRTRNHPIRWAGNQESSNSTVPITQLSMDEDKVKKSLDRLNERLKNMTTFL